MTQLTIDSSSFDVQSEFGLWLNSWPDGILALDADLRILYLSPLAKEITGWPLESITGKHVHDVMCAQSREQRHELEDCPFAQCSQYSAASDMISDYWACANGNYLSVDFRFIPLNSEGHARYVVTFSDNSEKLHNQSEMEKFAEYTDKNPMPMAEFDSEGQMLYGNPVMQEALVDFGFNDFGNANFLPENLADICRRGTASCESATNIEHEVDNRWYYWHFHPIVTQEETSILAYGIDATREKLAELEAKAALADARRDFYAKMIHELRTPLNAIIGFSDVLLFRSAKNLKERDQRALRNIKVAGIQLNEMITDTLDISKIEAGKMTVDPEDFYIADIFNDIRDQMEYLAAAKSLSYQEQIDLDVQLHIDKKKLRQIIINLISNAIKYTQKGGLTVKVSMIHDAKRIEGFEGKSFSLSVSDTGIGIPEEQLEILFKAYEQVKESKNRGIQGTGVGLALVNELIDLQHGNIDVQSEYGVGSTFTVELPLRIDAEENS